MIRRNNILTVLMCSALLCACGSHTAFTSVTRSRILIDSRFDNVQDAQAEAFIAPYKVKVDSIMSPVMGEVACSMSAKKPESKLSNLLSDILIWAAKDYNEAPVFSVYNIGGMRSAFAKGKVNYGHILDVAPFENKICFFDMSGDKVMELFEQIAMVGGEGVSHGVQMVITPDGKLVSVRLNGKEIDRNATYRVASIDYLAQGNDRLEAFKSKTNLNSPQTPENNLRYIICNYFKAMTAEGKMVDAVVEGRIVVKK